MRPFNINVLSGVLTRQHKITIPLLALLLPPLALAQIIPGTKGYEFVQTVDSIPQPRLGSNVIVDIQADPLDSSVWFSTGNGISNFDPPPDSLWRTWNESNGIGKGGVSASEVTDTVIWLATAYDTTVGISGAGGGLSFPGTMVLLGHIFRNPLTRMFPLTKPVSPTVWAIGPPLPMWITSPTTWHYLPIISGLLPKAEGCAVILTQRNSLNTTGK